MIKIMIYSLLLLLYVGYSPAQNWTSYTTEENGLVDNDVRAVVIDPFGSKWFATAAGLSRLNGGEWQTYTTADNLISNDIRDLALEQTEDGLNLWLATGSGVTEMEITADAASVTNSYTEGETPLISNDVTAILADKFGIKWFGTTSGISSYDGSNWRTYLAADSFFISSDYITSAFSLNDAAPVVTTAKHVPFSLDMYTTYDLTKLNYFGTQGGGASRLVVNGVDAITTGSPVDATWGSIVSDTVYAVFVDSQGEQWFGTDKGACQFVGSEIRERTDWKNFTTDSVHTAYLVFMFGIYIARDTSYAINGDGLADLVVQAICEDAEGGMWFGTPGGLTRFNRSAWYSYTTVDGLVHNEVTSLACDGDGSLWIGTRGGVSHLTSNIVAVNTNPQPASYQLHLNNYPNPFNSATTINYQLPVAGNVEMTIYNILGQKVRLLGNVYRQAGKYRIVWDGRNEMYQDVPSGIYLVRVTTDQGVFTHKIMLVK